MNKKEIRREKHDRLLRLFDGDGYEEFHTPKYIFVKHWNGNNKTWQVAIYPITSWYYKKPTRKRSKPSYVTHKELDDRFQYLLDKE